MSLATGHVLQNRYRIVRLIRRGGFGAIYRAWDLSLKKPCALKENTETLPAAAEQFTREATMLANLQHQNLPRVTDHFIIKGMGQYLVMDFVEGEDLQDVLERSQDPLPEMQVLGWIRQVGDALAYLHNRKPPVIHRDIKPANIRITPEGQVFLVDFGISKVYQAHIETTVGAKAVTVGFSPPEQYSGTGTDARSDIYALGATTYNLLTGEVPPESILRVAKTDSLKPVRNLNPAISPSTEYAVLKAMAINADLRIQRIEEFMEALSQPAGEPMPATQVFSPPIGTAVAASTIATDIEEDYVYPEAEGKSDLFEREKSGLARFIPWALAVIGAIVLIILIIFGIMWFGGGDDEDLSATQTLNAAVIMTANAPTNTKAGPEATYTPFPTYTRYPTHTNTRVPSPTPPPERLDPTDTEPPIFTSTSTPAQTSVEVSLRNTTGRDVNYYRYGRSGERHYLGWMSNGYYGTYSFPSLGEWVIEFCVRNTDGSSSNCRQKTINVIESGEIFTVP